MNKVFDLFILDVYLNTLRGEKKKRQSVVKSLHGKDKEDPQCREKAYLCFVEQWPMKTQHSFTWTGHTQHKMSPLSKLNILHTNWFTKNKFITRLELERVGKYNAMAPTTYLFLLKPQRLVPSCKKKNLSKLVLHDCKQMPLGVYFDVAVTALWMQLQKEKGEVTQMNNAVMNCAVKLWSGPADGRRRTFRRNVLFCVCSI